MTRSKINYAGGIPSTTDPSTGSAGDIIYNSQENLYKHWNGTKWVPVSNIISASGGIENTYTVAGVNYKSHTFLSNGTFTAANSGAVDILVVGGGGGGGGGFNNDAAGGGGGAGAFIVERGISVQAQAYSIVIGAGGAGGAGLVVIRF